MYAANAYTIRQATEYDALDLSRLAELDSEARELSAPMLIGERGGEILAAISLEDGRVIADPFKRTGEVVAHLRRRASGVRAVNSTPILRERLLGGLPRHWRVRAEEAA